MMNDLEKIKLNIVDSVVRNAPIIGLRNPMIGAGADKHQWIYPEEYFWTDSFWTGELWLAYMVTGKQELKNMARMRNAHLQKILNTPLWLNHDLGFEFSLSAVADYKLTGNLKARELGLRAAEALRSRYNWNGEYIVAWTAGAEDKAHAESVQGKIIIDCMQNLPLLLWAYEETNIESFKQVAIGQAETSLKYLVRDDFSTYHTFDFDPVTNKPLRGCTHQGYSDESCWSRGQGWAIHGFAQVAMMTGDPRYAELSEKLTEYMLDKITDDMVPIWDYLLPEHETQFKDTSAGSLTSAGLYILSEYFSKRGQKDKAEYYQIIATQMLLALHQNYDLTQQEGAQGLLSNSASSVPHSIQRNLPNLANAMLPYGDYYYFEATLRSIGHTKFFW
ncbi:glycoside hydrolase family 88 protein [Psychromonas sp. SR45-3]|uniref:glycoside hydrolase family 88 protein n=1 Tax=Psychromonas sp. SR45-3 TaxID=2760930 RepID=UPI0015FE504F|nr:glycoside hydrolase family 88 protein [Psychromonas sp. SR45-3]MBB1274333.1 glycoside hydrolase family 88 protein [Psychromonas sp. SR45-3]